MTKAVEKQATDGPGNVRLAINHLLAQLQRRNQRLAVLRNENGQLTLELAQRQQELLLAEGQIHNLANQRRRAVEELEIKVLEIEEQLRIKDGKIRELQRQADKSKTLSIRLAEREGALQVLAAELAELQSQVRSAEEEADLVSTQLVETQKQLARIRETLGWRLLSKFGRVKYGFLLPVYRRLVKPKKRET